MKHRVYKITNTVTGRFYIGVSSNVDLRFKVHIKNLAFKKHPSESMTEDYHKYGSSSFKLETVVSLYDRREAVDREDYEIRKQKPEYNSMFSRYGAVSTTESQLLKIGKAVRAARGSKSYYSIAKKAGVTQKMIENLEDGGCNCSCRTLLKVLSVLGLKFVMIDRINPEEGD